MNNATMPVKGGTDTADRIPGPLTLSYMRFGDRNLDSRNSHSTPNRPSIVGTSTASSIRTSSSTSSSSTYPSIFDDDPIPVETPLTPPDSKRISGLYAANLGKVSKLSLTGKGVYEERPSDYDHSQELQFSSYPQPGEQDADLEFTGTVDDVASRFSHAEIYNRSPIPLRAERRHVEELAGALGTLSIEENDTTTRQEPTKINEAVVGDAYRSPRPAKQRPLSYMAHPPLSKKKKIKIHSPPSSGTSSSSEEIGQRSATTVAATRSLKSTSTRDKTTKSSPKADLNAAAILAIDRYKALGEGSGSTSVDLAASSQDLPKGTPGKSLKRKQKATGANVTTEPIAAWVGRSSTSKTTSSQPKRKRAKQETLTLELVEPRDIAAVMTDEYHTLTAFTEASGCETDESDYATNADESAQSLNSAEGAFIEPQAAGLKFGPTFSRYHKEDLTGKNILDNIFKLLNYNGKRKARRRSLRPTPPKVETKPQGYGYLYMYTSPLCSDHIKIGMTSGTPHARIKQWNGECKLPIERVEDFESHPFLHFQLAEKLIMAELHNYRRKYKCHKCHRRHRDPVKVEEKVTTDMVHHGEWYEISEELGLATVQKWRSWLVTSNPYTTDGILRPSWALKLDSFSKLIATMDMEEWVAEWIQPLKTDEVIPYFGSHIIANMSDTWSEIRDFLSLLLGLLSTLQHIGEKGLDLLPFFGRFIFVITLGFILLYWISPTFAFISVIFSILTMSWIKF